MNIMVFIPNLDYGGVSNYSIRCVEMLKEEYENVYLVTFNNARSFDGMDIQIISGNNLLKDIFLLRKFIKNKNINKIITSIDMAPIIAKIASLGFKVDVFSVFHMRPKLYKLNSKSNLKNKIFDYLLKLSFVISKNIITVSNGLEKEVLEKYSKFSEKILTIYNPIIKELKEKEFEYVDIENKKEINILNVGWIYDLKNQMEILESVNLLNDNRINITFVGGIKDEVYYENLLKFIKDNNIKNVKFTGAVDDVNVYFEHSDIFILSSKSETLSNVLIEALANNTPVISSNCKYGPKEVLCNGKYGFLYNYGYNDLSSKIIDILNNETYNMFKNRCIYRVEVFTYENIKNEYIKVLNN